MSNGALGECMNWASLLIEKETSGCVRERYYKAPMTCWYFVASMRKGLSWGGDVLWWT